MTESAHRDEFAALDHHTGLPTNVLSSEAPPPVPGKASLSESILLRIFRSYPSKSFLFRDYSENATFEYETECEWPFPRFFGRGSELFEGRDVLDLGCGWGGRPIRWLEVGANSVLGVDVSEWQISRARAFAEEKGQYGARFEVGTGEAIPSDDDSFDLVVMNDVMEHVINPEQVVAECHRVLRSGGRLATVFPPYYDIFGGSHLHGYATSVPGLNLMFSTRTLKAATLRLFAEQRVDHRPFLRDIPTDKLWNMNGITIGGFEDIVSRSPFHVEQVWLIGHFDRRYADPHVPASSRWRAVARPLVYRLSDLATRTPLLREALTLRICAVLHKP
jgi:2-polyprenyl-3-methyl-5-hydroxy-6-metoxy-1,4-benzoquinol methylase